MAQVGLGVFTKKSTKMVLLGSNHRLGMEIQGLCDHKWLFYTTNQPHLSIFTPVWPSPNLQPTKPSRGLRLMSMLSLWAHSHAHYQISRYEFFSIYVTSKTSLPSPRDEVMSQLFCFEHSVLLSNEHICRDGSRLVCSPTEKEHCFLHLLLGVQVYLCMPLG